MSPSTSRDSSPWAPLLARGRYDHERAPPLVQQLVDLIRLPSQNPGDGETRVAGYVAARCRELGLEVETPDAAPGRPNVVAWLRGRARRPVVALNTHLDTVPISDGWTADPFGGEIRDGRVWGLGAGDAKGQIVAMLGAIETLVRTGAPIQGDLVFTAVADEELGSLGARAVVKGLSVDYAVIGEPTRLRVGIAHRGSLRPRILVRGRSAHSSTPRLGVNAIFKMRKVLAALEAYCEGLDGRAHPLIGPPSGAVTLITAATRRARCRTAARSCSIAAWSRASARTRSWRTSRRSCPGCAPRTPGSRSRSRATCPRAARPREPADARLVGLAVEAVREVMGAPGEVYGAGFGCDMTHFRGIGARRSSWGRATSTARTRPTSTSSSPSSRRAARCTRPPAAPPGLISSVADKPRLAHAVPAIAAPVVRTRDGAFVWFTVAYGLLNFGQGVFPRSSRRSWTGWVSSSRPSGFSAPRSAWPGS